MPNKKESGKITSDIRFIFHLAAGRFLGISHIVRYLRNPDPAITVRLLRAFGATVGERALVKRSLFLDNVYEDQDSAGDFSSLSIGENCYIGDGVYFDLADSIMFEKDVVVSGRASFITHTDCNRSEILSRAYPRKRGPILVKRGAWVGFNATVLQHVVVGEGTVIGACSLVMKDTGDRSIQAGVPAREVGKLGDVQ